MRFLLSTLLIPVILSGHWALGLELDERALGVADIPPCGVS